MSAASRNKGARYETEILRFFRERGGYVCMRSRQFKVGGGEEPDVLACRVEGGKPLQIEAKNRKTMPAKSHVAALEQAEACGNGIAIAVAKIARKPIEDAIVTMRFGTFLELYEGAERDPSTRQLLIEAIASWAEQYPKQPSAADVGSLHDETDPRGIVVAPTCIARCRARTNCYRPLDDGSSILKGRR